MIAINTVAQQIICVLSAFILLTSFILLTHKRIVGLVNTFAWQSFLLAIATIFQAIFLGEYQIYFSGVLTLILKVILIPYVLRRFIVQLKISRDSQVIAHAFYVLLGGIVLVIFCYQIISPVTLFPSLEAKNIVVVAMSVMLLGMFLMIVRRDAITHIIGFMEMENGLFYAALMSTQGMPMVVELGIAFDLLVAVVLFGVFFFHIRTSIESMDVDYLNRLREDNE